MAPKALVHHIGERGVLGDLEPHADRHSHLPSVSNVSSTTIATAFSFNICLVLLLVFLAHITVRRCYLSSNHQFIWPRGLVSRKRRVVVYGNSLSKDSEKSAIINVDHHYYCSSSIMAKSIDDNNKEQKDQAPAAVLRPQARTPTPHSGPSPTISLPQGRYTGVILPAPTSLSSETSSSRGLVPRAVEAWRGIPYAQTTGGANRFRPPVPLPPYDVARGGDASCIKADAFGQVCPSTASAVINAWEGEDCLNLNVYRPACSSSVEQRLPVIIYVHGGAFNAGSGTERNMASFVSWAESPLLAVSFNYRVGALGFPSSTMAEKEGCLNLGLRDQRMLFEWVRDNIGAFGGDGTRVTIMGMSAGAHSIGYHLQSYTDPATAPFQAAIMESGGPTARATLSPCHPRTESQWREFLLAASIFSSNNDSITTTTAIPSHQVFARLRALPLENIIAASNAVFSRYQDPIRWPFQPVIESDDCADNGQLITDLPISSFRRGKYLQVPILTGFNTNEGTVFCSPRVDTNEQFLAKFTTMIPGLSNADLEELMKVYPDPVIQPDTQYGNVPSGFGRQWARYEAAYAHYAYICPVLQTGHFYSHRDSCPKNREKTPPPPVWIYNFAALSRPDFGGKANHVDEAVIVSHDMGAIGQFPGLVATSDAMHGAFVRFIATGNPNPNPNPDSNQQQQQQQKEWWPRFQSPLQGDDDEEVYQAVSAATWPGRHLTRKPKGGERDDDEAASYGQVMMFGADNDERMGGTKRGRPAVVRRLSEGEVDQCRFWWDRVELSEGMGTRWAVGGRARL